MVLLQGRDHHPQAAHPDLQGDHTAAGSGPALTGAAGQVRVRGGGGRLGRGGPAQQDCLQQTLCQHSRISRS